MKYKTPNLLPVWVFLLLRKNNLNCQSMAELLNEKEDKEIIKSVKGLGPKKLARIKKFFLSMFEEAEKHETHHFRPTQRRNSNE